MSHCRWTRQRAAAAAWRACVTRTTAPHGTSWQEPSRASARTSRPGPCERCGLVLVGVRRLQDATSPSHAAAALLSPRACAAQIAVRYRTLFGAHHIVHKGLRRSIADAYTAYVGQVWPGRCGRPQPLSACRCSPQQRRARLPPPPLHLPARLRHPPPPSPASPASSSPPPPRGLPRWWTCPTTRTAWRLWRWTAPSTPRTPPWCAGPEAPPEAGARRRSQGPQRARPACVAAPDSCAAAPQPSPSTLPNAPAARRAGRQPGHLALRHQPRQARADLQHRAAHHARPGRLRARRGGLHARADRQPPRHTPPGPGRGRQPQRLGTTARGGAGELQGLRAPWARQQGDSCGCRPGLEEWMGWAGEVPGGLGGRGLS
jgi:hypothetical protein